MFLKYNKKKSTLDKRVLLCYNCIILDNKKEILNGLVWKILLYKTFNNIRRISFNENFATYKTAGEYNFNTPICLSELIEKLEEYNKELQDEKDRDNRE